MIHCAADVSTTHTAMVTRIGVSEAKSTRPMPTRQSTARPTRMGTYSVSATLTSASASERMTLGMCGRM